MAHNSENYRVGLRIDVDTYRGTQRGVPFLLDLLADYQLKGSFFFSVGPDNMGRHLWRLLKPAFLSKMLRSKAVNLYGWRILLQGTFWPGLSIGKRLGDVIQATDRAGHEIGFHAWDHHLWQTRVDRMSRMAIKNQLGLGMDELARILGRQVKCSAVAGWKCSEAVLEEKEEFVLHYNSDCRGTGIFRPIVGDRVCTPQIPVTLPTYDEVIGRNGISDDNYNDFLLSMIQPQGLNVLTIHAEVEGLSRRDVFRDFLERAKTKQIEFGPLSALLPSDRSRISTAGVVHRPVAGREGNVCWQSQYEEI